MRARAAGSRNAVANWDALGGETVALPQSLAPYDPGGSTRTVMMSLSKYCWCWADAAYCRNKRSEISFSAGLS